MLTPISISSFLWCDFKTSYHFHGYHEHTLFLMHMLKCDAWKGTLDSRQSLIGGVSNIVSWQCEVTIYMVSNDPWSYVTPWPRWALSNYSYLLQVCCLVLQWLEILRLYFSDTFAGRNLVYQSEATIRYLKYTNQMWAILSLYSFWLFSAARNIYRVSSI